MSTDHPAFILNMNKVLPNLNISKFSLGSKISSSTTKMVGTISMLAHMLVPAACFPKGTARWITINDDDTFLFPPTMLKTLQIIEFGEWAIDHDPTF
jgi:hypothetical protein